MSHQDRKNNTMKLTLKNIYSDKQSNKFLIQMFKIINYRKQHKLEFIPVKDRTETYIPSEDHHIIPKAFYRKNNMSIDNSIQNRVRLTYEEHIKVHILLCQYFKEKNDKQLYYAMIRSLTILNNRLNPAIIDKLSDDDIKELANAKKNVGKIISEQFTKERKIAASERMKKMNATFVGKNNPMYGQSVADHMTPEKAALWRQHLKERNFSGKRNPAYGRKWMHLKGSSKKEDRVYVKENEFQKYLKLGYVFGIKDKSI